MEKIVVNKDARNQRILSEFHRVYHIAKLKASNGYDKFTIRVNGDYSDAYEVCDKLKECGLEIIEKGYDSHIDHANVTFRVV